jgi:glycosyltransferase involved in cell wall biosynthesis
MIASISPITSIIIPVYNVEAYIHECLDSLVNQSLREIEIICVNDCSTDGSLSILKEYEAKDSRIVVIDKPVNEGLSMTRNVGINIATGRYILFVDSDDYVEKDLCRKVIDCAEKNKADLVFYDYAAFWTKADLVTAKSKTSSLIDMDPSDKTGLLNLKAYAWTKLVRGDYLRSLKLKFPDGLLYEDIPVHWQLVINTAKIALLPERLYFYRQRESSIGYRTDWKLTDYIYEYDLLKNFLVENNLYDQYRNIFLYLQIIALYVVYDNIDSKYKHNVMELILKRITKEHMQYIHSAEFIDWKVRDFFLAIGGSYPAKIKLTLWLFMRWIYRGVTTSYK